MVDDFNKLMDQERFAEAVVLAKKARELAPDNVTVEAMIWKSRFAERLLVEMSIRDRTQIGVEGALSSISDSSVPFDDRLAIEFPDAKSWADLTDESSAERCKTAVGGFRKRNWKSNVPCATRCRSTLRSNRWAKS